MSGVSFNILVPIPVMSKLVLALTVLVLISANGIIKSSSSPLFSPKAVPSATRNSASLELALQKEKYQFGAIGCTFSDTVCDLNLEYCFNDHAFGRCIAAYGNPTAADTFKYNLRKDDVRILEQAMQSLFEKGFRWTHSYTQCVLQNLLRAIKSRSFAGNFECFEDWTDDENVKSGDDPLDLAFLKLGPDTTQMELEGMFPLTGNIVSPNSQTVEQDMSSIDYPLISEDELEDAMRYSAVEDYLEQLEGPPLLQDSEISHIQSDGKDANEIGEFEDALVPRIFSSKYNTPNGFRHGVETRDDPELIQGSSPANTKVLSNHLSDSSGPIDLSDDEMGQLLKMLNDLEDDDFSKSMGESPGEGGALVNVPNKADSAYTEGGLIFLPNLPNPKRFLYDDANGELDDDEEELHLNRLNPDDLSLSGFERRERLDVKKPGPWYRTVNNFAFDKNEQQKARSLRNPEFDGIGPADMRPKSEIRQPSFVPNSMADTKAIEETTPATDDQKQLNLIKKASNSAEASKVAEQLPGNHFEIVDTSYVSLKLGSSIGSWNAARELVNLIADLLDIKHAAFHEVRLRDKNVITFKVSSNEKGLTATEVAHRIEGLKSDVERESGIQIDSAAVGVKAHADLPSSEPLILEEGVRNKNIYLATFAICGIVAATLVAAFLIFIIRKTAKSRQKLTKLSQDDPAMESCKDYQELCRARMASKNNEKVEPIRAVQRVQTGASRDSEGTSSSRSSTSSWSEEPVLSNMDISTGHMVLSYMEDHLKKKDRLDKEWAALCTYEADPGSTSIGEKPENGKKNRYTNSVPYDHSRVILNDLANVNGGDYINASTITDHDPRNPAYIATQGPLPNTAADFWQMVWEQGSVVIVTLTRLSENGTTLCHRYWPEEGSELHHIYEVHLVSEHIWCDEYLVRSFYLKNLKTGETRTVTQFHFLAWPENGIPTSAKSLLEFRRKVNKSYRGRSCPIIVHCSDGAGRTGTYCLIDMVLNRMTKGAKEIDIAASLEHIRDQRPGMVRTKQQFEFVLMAVAEEVHAILKSLPQ